MIPSFLSQVPIVGILRGVDPAIALDAARAAARAGLTAVEVTLNSRAPMDVIAALAAELPEVAVGAGTVMTLKDMRDAVDAGARFIVSPHFDREIVTVCVDRDIPVFPGALSPTEVWEAHSAGATMVKLFPAGVLGPAYVRALQGPLPQIDLLVTGGIDATNIAEYLAAGARAAAVGGSLFPKDLTDVASVEFEARALVGAIAG